MLPRYVQYPGDEGQVLSPYLDDEGSSPGANPLLPSRMATDKLRESLNHLGLQNFSHVFCDPAPDGLGLTSLDALLYLDNPDILQDRLEDAGAPRGARRALREWLKQKRIGLPIRPPEGSPAAHFYGLSDNLNHDDYTGLEAATILRVDVDPFSGSSKPTSSVVIPGGVLNDQAQVASRKATPIVCMVGGTGVGKSFITSSFMQRDSATNWPLVAKPGQHVPTSAHVCLHRGHLQPGTHSQKPLALLDFEGENGRTPKNLIEHGMRRMQQLREIGLSPAALQQSLDDTIETRKGIIKNMLPPLAYLLSDVVLFIVNNEPRDTSVGDRIRQFAEQAHRSVETLAWKPALLLVQNKWARAAGEKPIFDITDEYDWLQEGLRNTFAHVKIVRIPAATDSHNFENSLHTLHDAIQSSVRAIHFQRERDECLYSEREFWSVFRTMV